MPRKTEAKRADRSVVWWSWLLLVALGMVLTALFYTGRVVLSLDPADGPTVQVGHPR